jgi:MFS family permease
MMPNLYPKIDEVSPELTSRSASVFLASFVGLFCGPGPMFVSSLGLMMAAISVDFGWSRGTFSLVPLVASWTAALSSPVFGRLMDRFSPRSVLLLSTLLFGLGFLAAASLTWATWQFFLIYIILGGISGGLGPVGYNKILSRWFKRNRGKAIGLCAAMGYGGGFALTPLIVNLVIERAGWRAAYVAVAAIILCLSLPLSYSFLKEPSVDFQSSASRRETGDSRIYRSGLRDRDFWLLTISLFLGATAFYGTLVHLFALLTDRGFERAMAAAALSAVAIGSIGGQFTAGLLLDRINSPRVALLFLGTGAVGTVLIHFGPWHDSALIGAVLLGVGQGAELSVGAYLATRLFGLRAFGSLYGLIYGGVAFAAGIGPLVMGIAFDRTGSYLSVQIALDCGLLLALGLIMLLGPYRFTADDNAAPAISASGRGR